MEKHEKQIRGVGIFMKWFVGATGTLLGIIVLLTPGMLEGIAQTRTGGGIVYCRIGIYFMVIAGVFSFFIGQGLLQHKIWARNGAMCFWVIATIVNLIRVRLHPSYTDFNSLVPRIIFGVLIVVFLINFFTRPKVKEQFK